MPCNHPSRDKTPRQTERGVFCLFISVLRHVGRKLELNSLREYLIRLVLFPRKTGRLQLRLKETIISPRCNFRLGFIVFVCVCV